MANARTDHIAERHEQMAALVKDIEIAVLSSETTRDFNVLAMIMLVRSLDILASIYDEQAALKFIDLVIADRQQQRRVPATPDYIRKLQEMNRWLPAEDE